MALFTGMKNTLKPDSRSRVGGFQVSEHNTPAENWVTDPLLPVVLKNPYGGPGMEDVQIPMGRLVAVAEPVEVYTGKVATVLTLANGTNPVVGAAPFNYCKDLSSSDRFGGNAPTIITDKVIRLPYIPDSTSSDLTQFGHATGEGITIGDRLKPTSKGQYTKWIEGTDSITQIVGQVIGKDFNQEQLGWLKMAMWSEMAKYDDEIYNSYYNQSPNPKPGYGVPYSEAYKTGLVNMEKYGYLNSQWLLNTGVPGLTDGSGRSLTRFTAKALGTVPALTADGTVILIQMKDETGIGNLVDVINSTDATKKFVLKVDGVEIEQGTANGQYQINYKTGQIAYKALATASGKAITSDYCAYFYGTPSYIDLKGCIGQFTVLLKM